MLSGVYAANSKPTEMSFNTRNIARHRKWMVCIEDEKLGCTDYDYFLAELSIFCSRGVYRLLKIFYAVKQLT